MHKIDNLNNKLLKISRSARNQMINILSEEKQGSFIRLSVDSGGCSGFSYNFSIDDSYNKKNDIKLVSENDKLLFVTDTISIKYVQNSEIDWKETLSNSQFVIENPLATAKCGCGTSFSL